LTCLLVVVDGLSLRQQYKCDLVESWPLIRNQTQSMPTSPTSFHIQLTDLVFTGMTSVYCVLRVQSDTRTPSFQSVSRHQLSTLITSKSASTLASEEQPIMVCFLCPKKERHKIHGGSSVNS